MKYLDPCNDVAFKKVFSHHEHPEIVISFLNAVLELTGEKNIRTIEWLSPLHTPRIRPFRDTLIDAKVKDGEGNTFLVEIKVERKPGFQAYLPCRECDTDASCVTPNAHLPKAGEVMFIGILDFTEFETPHYVTRLLAPNAVHFSFIELPKFRKSEHECVTMLDKWLFFLKHAGTAEERPEIADTAPLRTAYSIVKQGEWNTAEREVYEYWDIRAQDERGAVQYAWKEGKRTGHLKTARKMLDDGLDVSLIMKYTGLSAEEIAALADETAQHDGKA